MANMIFANNANTTLNGGITDIATSMVVTSATGFPVPTGSQYFYCTLANAATQTNIEIVKVTAVSGTTFTIVRGQDGTTGAIFASGDVVSLRLVRASLNDFPKLDETNTFTLDQYFATTSGNVGVGTASPYSKLDVSGATGLKVYYTGGTDTNNAGSIVLGDGGRASNYVGLFRGTSISGGAAVNALSLGAYDYIAFNVSNTILGSQTERMRIFQSGGVSIGNTTDPGAANLSVTGTIRTQGYTVATLPAAGTVGRKAYVTDALAPVFLGTLTGGGSVKCPVFDNGTAWVAG